MNKIVQIQNIIYQYAYIAINNGYVLVASLLSLILLPNHADAHPLPPLPESNKVQTCAD